MLNRVILQGRLTEIPELRHTLNETAYDLVIESKKRKYFLQNCLLSEMWQIFEWRGIYEVYVPKDSISFDYNLL